MVQRQGHWEQLGPHENGQEEKVEKVKLVKL